MNNDTQSRISELVGANVNMSQIQSDPATGNWDKFKNEVASNVLGVENYDDLDKGALPSRANGYVGGTMTQKVWDHYYHDVLGYANTEAPGEGTVHH